MTAVETAAVILAAGAGTRMRSELPKVLHAICGRPMIRWVVDAATSVSPSRVVIVAGAGKEQVQRVAQSSYGGRAPLEFVEQAPLLGTGHALRTAAQALAGHRGTLLVLYGDVPLVRQETLEALLEAHGTRRHAITILTMRPTVPRGYGRILRNAAGDVIDIREEVDASPEERRITEVNSGLYAFETEPLFPALERLKPSPVKGEYYLTDAVREIQARGGRVGTFEADAEEVEGVNTRSDLARAAAVMRRRILERLMDEGVTILDPSTTYVDADATIGPDTVIFPFTVIRGAVSIGRGCEVGPFSHVRDGARLEDGAEIGNFVEVKKSRIGARTKAKHLAYLGDSEIGEGVNIGAGTITANFDGRAKHVTSIGDGAFVGSGTIIVAPATVGRGAKTGAGAVVTRGTEIPEGETYVGVPARKHQQKRG